MFKQIKFAELPVTDQDRAVRFYSERVGLKVFRTLQSQGVVFSTEPTEAPWAPGEIYALFLDSENNTIMIGSP